MGRSDCWHIGVVHQAIAEFTASKTAVDIQWTTLPAIDGFYADALVAPDSNPPTLLMERYDWRTERGAIYGLVLGTNELVELLPASEGHHSYPYMFRSGNRTFCLPEASRTGRNVIYELSSDPLALVPVKEILEGVPLVDATVFEHADRWWLLAARADDQPLQKLFAWWADEPFGSWTEHAQNPIKLDCRSSRPAGPPFWFEGRMHRPTQDCSKTYGGALAICVIERLTPTDFRERVINVVRPDPNGPYPDGIHTLCALPDGSMIVDGKVHQFHVRNLRRALLRRLQASRWWRE